jgi:hypothetical protein
MSVYVLLLSPSILPRAAPQAEAIETMRSQKSSSQNARARTSLVLAHTISRAALLLNDVTTTLRHLTCAYA